MYVMSQSLLQSFENWHIFIYCKYSSGSVAGSGSLYGADPYAEYVAGNRTSPEVYGPVNLLDNLSSSLWGARLLNWNILLVNQEFTYYDF